MSDTGCLLDASGALNNVSAQQISPRDVSLMLSLPPYLPQIEVDCQEMKGRRVGEGGGANQKMTKAILTEGEREGRRGRGRLSVLRCYESACVALRGRVSATVSDECFLSFLTFIRGKKKFLARARLLARCSAAN